LAALVRRVAFGASALALVIAFALTLSGIASTQGTLRPDGQAAALAAKERSASTSTRHRECRRHRQRDAAGAESGRV
jgi:pectin methylesterase-like acyl-CoA thioesterase